MLKNLVLVYVALLDFHTSGQLIQDAFNLFLIDRFYRLAHQFQRISVRDGFVVVICVDVVAENAPRLSFFLKERSSRKSYLHGIFVCLKQIRKETSFRIVASMSLVYEENPLKRCAVTVVQLDFFRVFLEFLDVNHHYLRLAHAVLHRVDASEIIHQLVPAACSSHYQTPRRELINRLFHKCDAVNNEIEFHGSLPSGIKVREASHGVVRQSCLPAPLSMPDDTAFDSGIQFSSD